MKIKRFKTCCNASKVLDPVKSTRADFWLYTDAGQSFLGVDDSQERHLRSLRNEWFSGTDIRDIGSHECKSQRIARPIAGYGPEFGGWGAGGANDVISLCL